VGSCLLVLFYGSRNECGGEMRVYTTVKRRLRTMTRSDDGDAGRLRSVDGGVEAGRRRDDVDIKPLTKTHRGLHRHATLQHGSIYAAPLSTAPTFPFS